MLAKRIIACLDTCGGRVVKGRKFKALRDAGDPRELAARYRAQGADEVVMLDVSATLEDRLASLHCAEAIARAIDVPLTVGGGVRCLQDAAQLFEAGADKVSINTAAVLTPSLVSQAAARYGSQSIVVAIDALRVTACNYRVVTHSATKSSERDAFAWAKDVAALGAGEILFTTVRRDGTQEGYDLNAVQRLSTTLRIPLVASGGASPDASSFADVLFAGADAALAASVFHNGQLTIGEVKEHCAARNISVRL